MQEVVFTTEKEIPPCSIALFVGFTILTLLLFHLLGFMLYIFSSENRNLFYLIHLFLERKKFLKGECCRT